MKFEIFLDRLTTVIALFMLLVFMCSNAKAADGDYVGPKNFHVAFGLSGETVAQEVIWQGLNVVDYTQSLKIAEHPDQWQEVGTPCAFGGGHHPGKSQVLLFSAVFAIGHYAITRGIESLVDENPDYRPLQRVWQYTMIGAKTWQVAENHSIGMGW